MVNRVKKSISIVLLPMLAGSALGQNITTEEEQPVVRRYTVEMIIFSYAQNVSAGTEVFVPDRPPAVEPGMDGELIDANRRRYEILMLPKKNFTLRNIFERLDNLDAYTPLMHFGWTQPTYPPEETQARPLSSFMTPPKGLQGDLILYLSRYLHLGVNLQLDAPAANAAQDALMLDDFGDRAMVTYPVRYRIEEDRIFRNGELRYFDHPKFGVLAKITRVEEEEVEEFEEELLGFDGE